MLNSGAYIFISMSEKKQKNIILFVGPSGSARRRIPEIQKKKGDKYRFAVLLHSTRELSPERLKNLSLTYDIILHTNFRSRKAIVQTLKPYEEEILAVTSHPESRIPDLAKIVPHLPYISTPTSESLIWSTDKLEMRRRFSAYAPEITPKHMVVKDTSKESIKRIERRVGFPLIIKPTGLAASILVNLVYHTEELERELKKVFRRVERINRDYKDEPARILVEQFMEGEMYSVDAYVDAKGEVYFCPMVHVKTGKVIGFDDFFAYRTITPTQLNDDSIVGAHEAAKKAIKALGLRSSTAHIEFIRTENRGWNIIEIGPRIGGFRDEMYGLSFNINHVLNDILIRIGRKPVIRKRRQGYTAVFKFFAKKEGTITAIKGRQIVQRLDSFHSIDIKKSIGDRAIFAKNGGKSVFNITLFHADRSQLLADIRRMEQAISIETE